MTSPAPTTEPALEAVVRLVQLGRLAQRSGLVLDEVGFRYGVGSGPWRGQALAIVREVTGDADALVVFLPDEPGPWAVVDGDGRELGCGDDEVEALTDALVRLAEDADGGR